MRDELVFGRKFAKSSRLKISSILGYKLDGSVLYGGEDTPAEAVGTLKPALGLLRSDQVLHPRRMATFLDSLWRRP
jgi:hypothetical protein